MGGFLVDHYGRRAVAIGSIALGALRMLALTQVHSLALGIVVICLGELVVNAYEPAVGALIADLAPEGRLAESYGLRRAAGQAGWVIGPLVGGLAARYSYNLLFVCSAAMLTVSTVVAFFVLPHGRGATLVRSARASPFVALRDRRFLLYTLAALVPLLLIGWYEGVTPVALRESRGVDTGTGDRCWWSARSAPSSSRCPSRGWPSATRPTAPSRRAASASAPAWSRSRAACPCRCWRAPAAW